MNTISKTLLQMAGLVALTGLGFAQSNYLKVHIPFAFTVADRTLPAGDYMLGPDSTSSAVRIRDTERPVQLMVLSIAGGDPAGPKQSQFVFRVHGGKHYLASTWNAVTEIKREFPATREEREVELASGPTTYEVLIARR